MAEIPVVSDAHRLAAGLGVLPEPVLRLTLIVLSGLPGTGKTYFCQKLVARLPFVVLESDALRKTLFPTPTYAAEESTRLFQAVHHLIEDLLRKGIPIILDATNLSERHRERLYNIAERLNAKLILVRLKAPPEVVHERLKARAAGKDKTLSDADWEVFQRMQPTMERIRRQHFAVDTSRDITPVLDKIVREVNR
mgnify:CR=1 FL=1